MLFKSTVVSALLSVLSLSAAGKPLDIFDPTILEPTASTVWTVGQTVNVTWDTSNAPAHISNLGEVVLTKGGVEDPSTLASGFSLLAGVVSVVVPDVVPASDYVIVLFGDSGNISPEFTIQA